MTRLGLFAVAILALGLCSPVLSAPGKVTIDLQSPDAATALDTHPDASADASIGLTDVYDPGMQSAWKRFREQNPYSTQGIAVGPGDAPDTYRIIVAEPPPDVTLPQLKAILPSATVREHPLGFDGWAADVTASVTGSQASLYATLNALNLLLFKTESQGFVLPIPAAGSPKESSLAYAKVPNSTVELTLAEFLAWLGPDTKWQASVATEPLRRAQVTKLTTPAMATSHEGGLIGFWIPAKTQGPTLAASFRKFAIQSDLILGGVGTDQGMLVVARERQIPLEVVPPMRFETFQLIYTQHSDEMSQSYERTHPLSGYLREEERDWAPAMLSDALVDTEFGQILNVSDSILKHDSNAGQTDYVGFPHLDRLSQGDYPFGRVSAPDHLDTSRLTYNWNTSGLGVLAYAEIGQYDTKYFLVSQTAALPVSYIPGGQTADRAKNETTLQAEQTATRWFMTSGNPQLIRDCQYASLFMIVRNLTKSATEEVEGFERASLGEYNDRVTRATEFAYKSWAAAVLDSPFSMAVTMAEDSLGHRLDAATIDLNRELLEGNAKEQSDLLILIERAVTLLQTVQAASSGKLRTTLDTILQRVAPGTPSPFLSPDANIREAAMLAGAGDLYFHCSQLDPPTDSLLAADWEALLSAIKALAEDNNAFGKWVQLEDGRNLIRRPKTTPGVDGWQRTQSIVCSGNPPGAEGRITLGGHNVGTYASWVVIDDAVPTGTVEIKQGIIYANPADGARISKALQAGKSLTPESLHTELPKLLAGAGAPAAPVRSRPVALMLKPADIARTTSFGLGFLFEREPTPVIDQTASTTAPLVSWWETDLPAEVSAAWQPAGPTVGTWVMTRSGDRYWVLRQGTQLAGRGFTTASEAAEAIAGHVGGQSSPPSRMRWTAQGLTMHEVASGALSLHAQLEPLTVTPTVDSLVLDEPAAAAMSRSVVVLGGSLNSALEPVDNGRLLKMLIQLDLTIKDAPATPARVDLLVYLSPTSADPQGLTRQSAIASALSGQLGPLTVAGTKPMAIGAIIDKLRQALATDAIRASIPGIDILIWDPARG